MFIYNINLNKTSLFKALFIIIIISILILVGISIYRIINNANFKVKDNYSEPNIINITSQNYTNILKTVHENLDSYVGKNICFSGYVYRVYDLNQNQFVLARDMIISSDFQTLVVGFLCDYKKALDFKDGTWVEITGEITKGTYHQEIPIIKITKMQEIQKPTDEYVYPPDDAYVPTSSLLSVKDSLHNTFINQSTKYVFQYN